MHMAQAQQTFSGLESLGQALAAAEEAKKQAPTDDQTPVKPARQQAPRLVVNNDQAKEQAVAKVKSARVRVNAGFTEENDPYPHILDYTLSCFRLALPYADADEKAKRQATWAMMEMLNLVEENAIGARKNFYTMCSEVEAIYGTNQLPKNVHGRARSLDFFSKS